MILIKTDKISNYLKTINRTHGWLASEMGIKRPYLSLIVNNKTKIVSPYIERLLAVTGISFEDLFYFDVRRDQRDFWGASLIWNGRHVTSGEYGEIIKELMKA